MLRFFGAVASRLPRAAALAATTTVAWQTGYLRPVVAYSFIDMRGLAAVVLLALCSHMSLARYCYILTKLVATISTCSRASEEDCRRQRAVERQDAVKIKFCGFRHFRLRFEQNRSSNRHGWKSEFWTHFENCASCLCFPVDCKFAPQNRKVQFSS